MNKNTMNIKYRFNTLKHFSILKKHNSTISNNNNLLNEFKKK